MSKTSHNNRGGRPRKVQYEELKQLLDDYFLYEAEGYVSALSNHGIYASLERYAQKRGFEYRAIDFRRCEPLKDYIEELSVKYSDIGEESSLGVPGYVPLDVDYFLRPDISIKERRQILIEQDKHNKNLHIKAAKALESYAIQRTEIEDLRRRLQLEVQKGKDEANETQTLKRENKSLLDENRYLKRYIHKNIEPTVAESVLLGQIPNNSPVRTATLMPPKNKESAVITISEFLSSDTQIDSDEDDIDRLILSKMKRGTIIDETDTI